MTRELREIIGGVPIGHDDRAMRLLQFRDMTMGTALRFIPRDDEEFIRRNFAGTFTDQTKVDDWFYERATDENNQEDRQADS